MSYICMEKKSSTKIVSVENYYCQTLHLLDWLLGKKKLHNISKTSKVITKFLKERILLIPLATTFR